MSVLEIALAVYAAGLIGSLVFWPAMLGEQKVRREPRTLALATIIWPLAAVAIPLMIIADFLISLGGRLNKRRL